MRNQRNELSPQQQLAAARALSQQLMSLPWFQRAQKIAVYLANDGEIDPIVVSTKAMYRKRQCYLPSMHPLKKGQLIFGDYQGPKIKNRFDIEEPDPKRNEMLNPQQLDLVLLPLVAFDAQGGRLGMGGGFYDRTFEFLKRPGQNKPKLVGLAHHFQQVESLPLESWDVPLSAIVTDKGIIQS
jgi:5-formyltetrahydrofolate cyclo-ligase